MRLSLISSLIAFFFYVPGCAATVNLDSLYRVLDAAIDSSTFYKQHKMDAIKTLERQYRAAHGDLAFIENMWHLSTILP